MQNGIHLTETVFVSVNHKSIFFFFHICHNQQNDQGQPWNVAQNIPGSSGRLRASLVWAQPENLQRDLSLQRRGLGAAEGKALQINQVHHSWQKTADIALFWCKQRPCLSPEHLLDYKYIYK